MADTLIDSIESETTKDHVPSERKGQCRCCHWREETDAVDEEKQKGFQKAREKFSSGLTHLTEGKYSEAEVLFLESKDLCKNSSGVDNPAYAFTVHSLADAQVKQGKLDEAEASFREVIELRKYFPPTSEARYAMAMSRDGLAQVYEKRGDHKKARSIRMTEPESMICSFAKCPIRYQYCQCFSVDKLKMCSMCECVFYCTRECQVADWKSRHKEVCKPKRGPAKTKNSETLSIR